MEERRTKKDKEEHDKIKKMWKTMNKMKKKKKKKDIISTRLPYLSWLPYLSTMTTEGKIVLHVQYSTCMLKDLGWSIDWSSS